MRSLHALGIAALLALSNPAHADVPILSPNLYEQGNLRVGIACAESLATPYSGLRVELDGAQLAALRTNVLTGVGADSDGNPIVVAIPTDVGYLAPPGRHHLRIAHPNCADDDRDVDLSSRYAERVSGRLAISNPALLGPVGAPNGFGFFFGGFVSSYPSSLRSGVSSADILPTSYAVTDASIQGVLISSSFERRHFVLAVDEGFGWGSIAGTATALPSNDQPGSSPMAFTGSMLVNALGVRVGARLPLRYVSLAAGTGIGVTLWITNSVHASDSATVAPIALEGLNATWGLPLWTSITVKPACSWGIQLLGSYQIQPTDTSGNTLVLGAGLMWQPSAACAEAPGITTSP